MWQPKDGLKEGQTTDRVIPFVRHALQETQKTAEFAITHFLMMGVYIFGLSILFEQIRYHGDYSN